MKKSILLLVALMLLVSTVSVLATEGGTVVYRLTKVEDYESTFGQFVVFTEGQEVNLNNLGPSDYKVLEGAVDYVEVPSNLKLKEYGVKVEKVDFSKKQLVENLTEGTYLVRVDMEPGFYEVEGDGYVLILNNVKLDTNEQIARFERVEGLQRLEVKQGDYAVKLINVKAKLIK